MFVTSISEHRKQISVPLLSVQPVHGVVFHRLHELDDLSRERDRWKSISAAVVSAKEYFNDRSIYLRGQVLLIFNF